MPECIMNGFSMFLKLFSSVVLLCFFFLSLNCKSALAAYVLDNTAGTYTDNFADNTGVPTRNYVNVETSAGVLQLTSAASQSTFTTPYASSGYATTNAIRPYLFAKWGTLTIDAIIPADTTLKVQILDYSNNLFADQYLPGNSVGIAATSIDLSNIPIDSCGVSSCTKPFSVKIKFLMTTTNTLVTPTINGISFNWTKTQGDFTPTKIMDAHWPAYGIDQQRTYNTKNSLPGIYPTFKWVGTSTYSMEPNQFFVANGTIMSKEYIANKYYMYKRNLSTNAIISTYRSTVSVSDTNIVLAQNNTMYGSDFGNDVIFAYDMSTDSYKWVYSFGGGHGNQTVLLGDNGILYAIRQNSLESGAKSKTLTLFAINPDGTIKYSQNYTQSDYIFSFGFSFSSDQNTIYFATCADDNTGIYYDYDESPTANSGRLYAVNADTGEVIWYYETGNLTDEMSYSPVVGTDGTIYVASRYAYSEDYTWPGTWPLKVRTKKLYAINSDGTLKWVKTTTDTGQGYKKLMLRNDGVLMAQYHNDGSQAGQPSQLFAIDTTDGSVLWTGATGGTYSATQFVDSANGIMYYHQDPDLNIGYYNKDGVKKWLMYKAYNETDGCYVTFRDMFTDDNGDIYGYIKACNSNLARAFALGPWTLSVENEGDNYNVGDVIRFTAKSSMSTTNLFFGGDNMMQVVMDNGDKVELSYSSTDSLGNTVWIGEYVIPSSLLNGAHTYTLEASQARFQTDIPTYFDSAPLESGNTGINLTRSFRMGPPECVDQKPSSAPKIYQIDASSTYADIYFSQVANPVSKYIISYGTQRSNMTQTMEVIKISAYSAMKVTIGNLQRNTQYYFKIKAVNGCKEGDNSAVLGAKTPFSGQISYYFTRPYVSESTESVVDENPTTQEPVIDDNPNITPQATDSSSTEDTTSEEQTGLEGIIATLLAAIKDIWEWIVQLFKNIFRSIGNFFESTF